MDSDSIFFLLFLDDEGNWFAAPPGFQTLLRHPIGRGRTRIEAIQELLAHPDFVDRAKKGEWAPEPRLADFIEMRAPRWTTWTTYTSIDLLAEAANSALEETTRTPGQGPTARPDTVRTI
jgi:hypothetical protein